MNKLVYFIIFMVVLVGSVYPHGGRTDKYGGHHNRKTGGYHFHNAGNVHHSGNPYQNHNTCGVCSVVSTKPAKPSTAEAKEAVKIKMFQSCLTFLGHETGGINGKESPTTTLAIRLFQSQNGLKKTGKIDNTTARKILLSAARKFLN